MRVVIADDVMLVRTGIATLLDGADVEVVGQCGEADSLLRLVATERPDAAIVDIRMPPNQSDEGIVAARRIRELYPDTAVLVLSQHLDAVYAQRLLADEPSGLGYLLKEKVHDVSILLEALWSITSGQCVVDDAIIARLVRRNRAPGSNLAALSAREALVLGHLAEGRSNAGIAKELGVSEKTVEASVAAIFRKLRLTPSRTTNRRVLAVRELLKS
jgi:DNA-binding NarL/FixJ family response regulator